MSAHPVGLLAHRTRGDAWEGQAQVGRQLVAWSIGTLAGGAAAALVGQTRGNRAIRAFGVQNMAWGAIDLGIAGFGEVRRRARMSTFPDPRDAAVQEDEWRSLRRILLVNAGLDVGYVAAGLAGLAWTRRGPRPLAAAAGHWAAVVVQGGFLLVFDTVHARWASRAGQGRGRAAGCSRGDVGGGQ